ncbi:MerR family transcriptional regulator [Ruania halotolerans]|uniref:MerR family transcriptional regulator n=1 Tax=Ruania halotolerans TaxID=2897773 RepID=UPI001E47D4E8|nr:MerR family transcriptional regulator [Ruania halotolerans]UFU05366.1 MerR family transcriptional regulator [Ruania halotolerans]
MRIGELAQRTGASIRSLRYYENRGLLAPARTVSGQRQFDESDVHRVSLIRQLLAAGLGTAAIADVLPCMSDPAAQTSLLTARLMKERDRLTKEIEERVTTREALTGLIDAAPPLHT